VIQLHPNHWTQEDFKQRMTSKEWGELLLRGQDSIIFKGNLVNLKVKNLGYGIVEVGKESEC